MADQHVVRSVERHNNPDHWRVFFEVPAPGGGTQIHCLAFHPVTLLWRAAEYGIDAEDVQTLLDVVLHEQHMVGHDHTSPDFLYNTDQESARSALLDRVEQVRDRIQITDPDGLLSAVTDEHRVDPEDFELRRQYIAHVRRHGHHQSLQPEFLRGANHRG